MLCAISGEAPETPVASRKSGNVFEKRLIEAYIAENGKDPVNGEELTTEDLVELKSARVVRPRPPTLTSIPSLLSVFQNEWDALALETYTLKQQLAQTRQELSTALYQHDAAVRVIARISKERDEAREALSKVTVTAGGATTGGDQMQIDSSGLPEPVAAKIDETQAKLSKTRRKRAAPPGWVTGDLIQSWKPLGSSGAQHAGCKSLVADSTGDLMLYGGRDGVAGVYSLSKQKTLQALKGGSPITDAAWYGESPIISTAAGAIKIFDRGTESASFKAHAGPITALAMHPSGEILASVGVDKSYVLYDLVGSAVISQTFTDSELTTASFHPDGHLFAAGSRGGEIKVFDVKSAENVASFEAGAPPSSLSFSENGTWLAAANQGETSVTIWDLRNASKLKVLEMGGAITVVRWDYTGQFLAAGGPSGITVQQYTKATKKWSEPLKSAVPALALAWGSQGQSLAAVDENGGLTILGSA